MLSGGMPGFPHLFIPIVDVRDVADLHIRAMTAPEAAGQRFIAAGQFAWMAEMVQILRDGLGAQASKVPTRKVPDFVLRLVALVDRDLGAVTPSLGKKHEYSSAKAQKVLGWKPRPMAQTIIECGKSLIAAGAV